MEQELPERECEVMTRRKRVRAILAAYAVVAGVAFAVFFAERNRSWPSGIGVLFGPLNYFGQAFEFGVSWAAVEVNILMLLGVVGLGMLPDPFIRWGAFLLAALWFVLGFLAHAFECEFPWAWG